MNLKQVLDSAADARESRGRCTLYLLCECVPFFQGGCLRDNLVRGKPGVYTSLQSRAEWQGVTNLLTHPCRARKGVDLGSKERGLRDVPYYYCLIIIRKNGQQPR